MPEQERLPKLAASLSPARKGSLHFPPRPPEMAARGGCCLAAFDEMVPNGHGLRKLDPASIDAFATRWLGSGRPLHILVNSAGNAYGRRTLDAELATLAREMVEQGTALEAACRIIILEDQLEEALRQNQEHERREQAGA